MYLDRYITVSRYSHVKIVFQMQYGFFLGIYLFIQISTPQDLISKGLCGVLLNCLQWNTAKFAMVEFMLYISKSNAQKTQKSEAMARYDL